MGKGDSKTLPNKYGKLFGSIKVKRGTLDGSGEILNPDCIKLVQWDAAPPCTREACACFEICDYKDKAGRCKTFVQYMHACVQTYFDGLTWMEDGKRMTNITEAQWRDIGFKIMPLWGMACRLKIEITGADRLMYHDNKGNLRTNPMLKELRETLWLITRMEKACDISDFLNNKVSGGPEPEFGTDDDDYYAQLESPDGPQIQDPNRRKIIKRRAGGKK